MILTTTALTALLILSPAYAASESGDTRAMVEELMEMMNIEDSMTQTQSQLKAMVVLMIDEVEVPDELRDELVEHQTKMIDMIMKEMSWDRLKSDFIAMYVEIFDQEEIAGLLDFYRSPVGQSFLAKTPQLMARTMEIAQKHAMDLFPKIQSSTEELVAKLTAAEDSE